MDLRHITCKKVTVTGNSKCSYSSENVAIYFLASFEAKGKPEEPQGSESNPGGHMSSNIHGF
jgi:hypothetical protein